LRGSRKGHNLSRQATFASRFHREALVTVEIEPEHAVIFAALVNAPAVGERALEQIHQEIQKRLNR
jgi:hypothetical protein